ncbi:MAG TPA: acetyl-CoA carboxylase biotin carboxyl carrier protein [Allosphingosinicella sp.]|jgi:acetyl-CoA carboxylase biotin carboxyl carrier protein|uniref:acetyl-CoA carboxylase biotin carboxyl carrier protein n=1 Tax=Allosphingosinicella sp. TaxID=2823234 RepID=UPI002F2A9486
MTDTRSEGALQVDTDLVRQLASLLNESDLSEIEVQDGARRIVVKRKLSGSPGPAVYAGPAPAPAPTAQPSAPAPELPAQDNPGTVRSPMVGTVYLSGEPGAKPFATPGDRVSEGDTLVIIEAMKVMNPIAAPRSGIVRQIFVSNGQPVEYDQPLLVVE